MDKDPGLGTAHDRAWRALLKGHALLVGRLDADLRARAGMSLIDYDVLVQLSESPRRRLAMAELADAVVYSRSGLTRLVDTLERRGWVVRERDQNDRRYWYAVLTPDGLAALEAAWPVHVAGVRAHFAAHAGEDQARTISAVFGQVIADLAPQLRHLFDTEQGSTP